MTDVLDDLPYELVDIVELFCGRFMKKLSDVDVDVAAAAATTREIFTFSVGVTYWIIDHNLIYMPSASATDGIYNLSKCMESIIRKGRFGSDIVNVLDDEMTVDRVVPYKPICPDWLLWDLNVFPDYMMKANTNVYYERLTSDAESLRVIVVSVWNRTTMWIYQQNELLHTEIISTTSCMNAIASYATDDGIYVMFDDGWTYYWE